MWLSFFIQYIPFSIIPRTISLFILEENAFFPYNKKLISELAVQYMEEKRYQ